MKKCLLSLVFAFFINFCHSQTLKITSTDGTEERLAKFASEHFLGKTLKLAVYDNSVIVTLEGKNDRIILYRANEDDKYVVTEKENESEKYLFYCNVNKTLGIITSVKLVYAIQEKIGQRRWASWTLNAKRF
jgi:hypothetical protein